MSLFPVFSRRLTRELEKRGFKVIKMAPNKNYPQYVVYYFEETPELRQAVIELTK